MGSLINFFQPFFIILIFGTIILIKYKKNFKKSFFIFLIAMTISFLPSIKNKIELNFFGNSSWIGFQVIQVLKKWEIKGEEFYHCKSSNLKYQKKYTDKNRDFKNNDPSLIGALSKWNNVGMIYRTKKFFKTGRFFICCFIF